MDPSQINLILLALWTVLMTLIFGLQGYFADRLNNGNKWDWAKFTATILYSLVVSYYLVVNSVVNLDMLAKPFSDWLVIIQGAWLQYFLFYSAIYQGIMYTITKFIDPLLRKGVQFMIGAITPVDFSISYPTGNYAPCLVTFQILQGDVSRFYFGDGTMWDGKGTLQHTYIKAGAYTARAVQITTTTDENGIVHKQTDYRDREVVVWEPTEPPKPPAKKTLLELIVEFFRRLLHIGT
jgi:hypothetical protein